MPATQRQLRFIGGSLKVFKVGPIMAAEPVAKSPCAPGLADALGGRGAGGGKCAGAGGGGATNLGGAGGAHAGACARGTQAGAGAGGANAGAGADAV